MNRRVGEKRKECQPCQLVREAHQLVSRMVGATFWRSVLMRLA